jgi:hypothetical protein
VAGYCGNAAIAAGLFFKKAWQFKDIFSEIGAFLKISILFKAFPEKLRIFLSDKRLFQKLRGFSNTFIVELRLFLSDVRLFRVM